MLGETLSVFYREHSDGGALSTPVREILFLRRGDHVLYATLRGKAYQDPEALPQLFAPLVMSTPMGPCPFTMSDEYQEDSESPDDGFECYLGAVAELHLAFADEPPLVLTEGNTGALKAGERDYAVDVRRAQLSQGCVDDVDRRIVTLAVALQ